MVRRHMKIKLIILIALVLTLTAYGSMKANRTVPLNHWSEQFAANSATPYPTPIYDPARYAPASRPGKTVTVRGVNLADKIQAAQDDPTVGTVKIEGGGSI